MTTSLSSRRQQARIGGAAIEREIDTALAELKAAREEQSAAAKARAEAAAALEGTIALADLAGARMVRDATGWHPVLKINKTTVTIPGAWGGTARIRIDKIRETRA